MGQQEPDFEALSSAVATVRELIVHLRRTTADPDTLAAVEREIRALNERLAPHDYPGPFAQRQLFVDPASMGPERDTDDPIEYFPYSPVIGPLNPIAPAIDFRVVGRELHATHVFDPQYNGPPLSVHGGIIALVFDELLGSLGAILDVGGFTGTLEVVYRSLTPLHQPIRMRSWIEREEGSKIFIHGTMHTTDPGAEERLCAEARGIFIRPKRNMLADVVAKRGGAAA